MAITLEPKKVTIILGTIIIFLVLANIVGIISTYYFGQDHVFGIVPVPLFDLDLESNIPTWYSSLAILLASILLFVIARARKRQQKADYLYWLGLALIFLLFSCDEIACFHEKLSKPIRNAIGTSGPLFFAWVIPYGMLAILIALAYLRFWLKLPGRVRTLVFCGGLLYVGGGLGLELIGANYFALHGGQRDLIYALITTGEETSEMVGILIFNYGLMTYIDLELSDFHLRVSSRQRIRDCLDLSRIKAFHSESSSNDGDSHPQVPRDSFPLDSPSPKSQHVSQNR